MPQITWLALGYNVPVNPSKNRVYVWRKLKELGAGYFRPGVALLPKSAANMAKLRQLSAKIREMGGDSTIAELKFCDARDEADTIERFRTQSEDEYQNLLQDLGKLMDSVQKNIFPPDEHRDQMKKVARRYKQVKSRDYFMASARDSLKSALDDLVADIGDLF